jgi:hypothetical protein
MPFFGSDHVWWSNLTGAAVFWSSAFPHGPTDWESQIELSNGKR